MAVFLAYLVALVPSHHYLAHILAIYALLDKRLYLAHQCVPPVPLALPHLFWILVAFLVSLVFTRPQQAQRHAHLAMLASGPLQARLLVLNVLLVHIHTVAK